MSGPGAQLWSRNYDLVALELPACGEMFYRFRDSFKSPVLAESFRLFLIVFIHLFIFLMAFWSLLGEPFQACPARRRPPGRPRTRWGDYICRLAWERFGINPLRLVPQRP